MRAILEDDVIIKISETYGDTEIGDIPPEKVGHVGFDRLRFNGEKLVDLMDLEYLWVKHIDGSYFEFHVIEVSNSQRIRMSYADRKRLILESDVIRIRTLGEMEKAARECKKREAKNKLRSKLANQVGDEGDQTSTIAKLVYLLIMSLRGHDKDAGDLLDMLLNDIEQTYSMDKMQDELPELISKTKLLMNDYDEEVD